MREQSHIMIVQRIVYLLRTIISLFCYIILYTFLMYGIICTCRLSYDFCYETFGSVAVSDEPGKEIKFQVFEEDTIQQVSQRLEELEMIRNQYSFMMRTKLMEPEQIALRPGTYQINNTMDYKEIISIITDSK